MKKNEQGSRERSRNLKAEIYRQLREQIVFLDLKPGEFINETRLASELGVSRTVLREILQRLSSEGLLSPTPGQGVHVQGIDLLLIKNVYEMRVPLEGLAGRLAADRARPEHLIKLRELIRQTETAAGAQDYRALARLDWEAHEIIGDATRNPMLADTLLRLLIPFNRLWYMVMSEHGRIGNFLKEWQEILAALERRSPAAAEKALVEHMAATPPIVQPVLQDLFGASNAARIV